MTDDQFKDLVERLAYRMALDELAEINCLGRDAKERIQRWKESNNQKWLMVTYAALSACINLRSMGYLNDYIPT